ncbi:hypothetical protein GOP47_0006757 [Adiantum capillus-veneris]|uniref:Pentatricopeptide repeat-containing protein n=1 Tax=Adiantum capillus-veneris TaxID=13818 RepID=A0A9D4V483_ADICA|nr:hypothetical protein GOP47_0006757 [Adiantum capillus-veneris]
MAERLFASEVKHRQEEHDEELKATSFSFLTRLKACAQKKDLYQVSRIHTELRNGGLLQKDPYLGSALVNVYAKCSALVKAREVLNALPARDVITWNALIAGYAQHGRGKEALGCFHEMQREGLSPNASTYTCTLKACGLTQGLHIGERIHGEVASKGLLEKHVVLGNALVDMYVKCGALTKAQKVLNELSVRNVVSWNALIAGYAQHGCGKEALRCFHQMRREDLSPNAITYACTLKACGLTQDVHMGERIHDEISSQGLLLKHVVLGNALVDMYAKCGALMKAREVLDGLPIRDIITWNALMAGYAQHGCGKEVLGCFHQMPREGLSPDAITYACTLKACGLTQDVDMGERIHDEIASHGLLEKDIILGNALVDMYAKCGALPKAKKVLEELSVRNVVSWSSLISGYAQHGSGKEALCCFRQLRSEGLSPNAITYACTLKACALTQDLHMGERIHDEIASQGLLEKGVELGNALVDMYAKCGALTKAREVLEGLPVRDIITWNALIAGYAQYGCGKEALDCFHQMRREGLSPDAMPYACTLKACGLMQDLHVGERIHNEIASQGLLDKHVELGNALVDMYAKCGALMKAREVLDGLPVRNVVSWSALIAGYAQHGWGKEALGCFQEMRREGLSPDAITYACTLKACGIAQDIDMGVRIHDEIASQGLLEKDVVLGNALVDMYAKCGALKKAQKFLMSFLSKMSSLGAR